MLSPACDNPRHLTRKPGDSSVLTCLNIPSVSRQSGCWRKLTQAAMMGGTEFCWLSMIHSSVTPNCWLATQLDMDRLVVETAWDNLNTVSYFSNQETGGGGVSRPVLFFVIFSHWVRYWQGV